MLAAGCNVTEADIEHWKHTQRGPGKITTVLTRTEYALPMRVRAARALIEMKHPNVNGLDRLQSALGQMPASEREQIVHALLPELASMMRAQGSTPSNGPSEAQIKAKDAAFVLIRGDGRQSFANAEDRTALSTQVLDWMLADFNGRALAGSFTAEQIVNGIGPSSAERLTAAVSSDDSSIPVIVELAKLINGVATPEGKQAAVARVVAVAREVEGEAITARLRTRAQQLIEQGGVRNPSADVINRGAERLRGQYLTVIFEAVKTLGQSNGTDYLLAVARNAAVPLDRRKAALTAMAGTVASSHTDGLFEVLNCAPSASCDLELRALAADRVGETRDRAATARLFTVFDASNGNAADNGFTLRWKIGEAILKLGGASVLSEFAQHLGAPRVAPFVGYTFAELNGEAQAVGDMTPPPRDAMRALTAASNPLPVRLLAIMFLGIKGEERDLALLQGFASDSTAIPGLGEGWTAESLTTVGAVATKARQQLQQALRGAQQPAANAAQ
ncbi:MAG: hypothetical protein JNK72_17265 [Myxococcales bacterium]|nr:hypothetical protein [Myxococcales bacterium]